jgi:hypothetical protein
MTWQLSSAEWIQEQGAFVPVASARPTRRVRRKVLRLTNSDGLPLPGGIKYTVDVAPQLGPGACLVCGCKRFGQRYPGSTICHGCGHGVEFHARRVER